MKRKLEFQFTIRDLLLATAVVAAVFASFANVRQFDRVLKAASTSIWNRVAEIKPLMGRESVEPEW